MKRLFIMLLILLYPMNIMAYSSYIMPGGDTLGIEVDTKGIMVIGFYKVNNTFNKGNPALQNGDYIISINNENVASVNDMTKVIEKYTGDGKIDIVFNRGEKNYKTSLDLIYSDGMYKTGLYVKSTISGIGTLSYIDPETMIFGALGHEIIESTTNNKVEIKSGEIFNNIITGIQKSKIGSPGSKLAKFDYNIHYGNVYKNTKYGIFGIYNDKLPSDNLLKVSSDIKIGKAYIKTVINDSKIENFEIEITSINENSEIKNISLRITDSNLIDKTGGVVQGMSGSPIIQGDNIVGVLTHVIVDNPITGYGIFIEKMLTEGDMLRH